MKTAAVLLAVATTVLTIIHLYAPNSIVPAAAISCGTACYHFAMRLLVGALVPPIKGTSRWFRPRRWEAPLYRFLRVKSWKKHLPTYNPDSFSLDHHTPQEILANMCQAEVVHEIIVLCSFLPLLAVPVLGALPVFLITSCLSAALDLIFVIAQRFNRPRILRLTQKRAFIQSQKEFQT